MMALGPAQFTWQPGIGAVAVGSDVPFADFSGTQKVDARLLTFGSDGRKHNPNDLKEGYLRGRFAADQNLIAADSNTQASLPLSMIPRFSMAPMRHFISEMGLEFNYSAAFHDIKTPLNPRHSSFPALEKIKKDGQRQLDWSTVDGAAFPGGHHASGIFANAPVVLMANQISTSANAFTIHIVAQSIDDKGATRKGIANSGPGHSDPDDVVMAERWARVVVEKLPHDSKSPGPPRFRVVHANYVNR
jgi:hypothetical protein